MNEQILIFEEDDTTKEIIKKLVDEYKMLVDEQNVVKQKEINLRRAILFNNLNILELSELIADNFDINYSNLNELDSLDLQLISDKKFEFLLVFKIDLLLKNEILFALKLDTYFNHLRYFYTDKNMFNNQIKKLNFWIDYLTLLGIDNKELLYYRILSLKDEKRFDEIINIRNVNNNNISIIIDTMLELKKYDEAITLYNKYKDSLFIEYDLQIVALKSKDQEIVSDEWRKAYVNNSSLYTNISSFDIFKWSPYIDKLILKNKDNIMYHYTDGNALLNIISNKELWLTKFDYLNDAKEGKLILDYVKEFNLGDNVCNDLDRYFRCSFDDNNTVDMEDAYIMSNSTEKDNLTLWGNYSNFVGYNIAFDINLLVKSIKDSINLIPTEQRNNFSVYYGRILYEKEEIKNIVKDMISEIEKDFDNYSGNSAMKQRVITNHLIFLGNFIKSPLMAPEKEYRILILGNKNKKLYPLKKHYRTKENAILPYVKIPFSELASIKEVTIGAVNKLDITKEGIKQLLIEHGYENVVVDNSGITLRFK